MVYADLHVHTDVSDGTLSLSAVPAAARRSGVSVVAITDHDRVHPGLSHPVTVMDGVEVVHGIELRVQAADQRVDLLAYGVAPTESLRAELARIQRDRVERGRAIVECVEDRLDVSLDVDLVEGVGRPHVARAVVDHGDTAYERLGDVFEDLIGETDPCFVARDVPAFADALPLLQASSHLVSLAHPFRYPDPEGALALCEHLDAVEAVYPYDGERGHDAAPATDAALLAETVEEYALVETGGSDAHGRRLGLAGLSAAQYDRVAEHLPVP
ncbi:MAG: PHP domain-containing protein [Halobacteriota archaeon]